MVETANAFPTKRFFVEMLTRDITLEDAILDLVDNSIDGVFRQQPTDIERDIIEQADARIERSSEVSSRFVDVRLSPAEITVKDNAGGIPYQDARRKIFRFGRAVDQVGSSLSVYGIGLKRAVFKLGGEIMIESHTIADGFRVDIDVARWMQLEDDWTFMLESLPPADGLALAGTVIRVRRLHSDIRHQITHGNAAGILDRHMRKTYAYFLNRHVTVRLDGNVVLPERPPLGFSEEATPSRFDKAVDGVNVHIFTGLAKRELWKAEFAGWYILCNGRVIVSADRTHQTEWGVGGFPAFVSKFRGFVGIVLLFSRDPEKLPWTTTKRGFNKDSHVYQSIRDDMRRQARPVLNFLNDMYPSDEPEAPPEREIADKVKRLATFSEIPKSVATFTVSRRKRESPRQIRVQYDATETEIARARTALRRPTWSASRVGRYALEYLLENEGPD